MADSAQRIRPLSADTRAHIQSSVHITSLDDVVSGLFKNALDAGASDVTVRVDLRRGSCVVVDNGHGIPRAEFLNTSYLGRAFCTSRANDTSCYGRHGQFLAALCNVAVVRITSKDGPLGTNSMVLAGSRNTTNLDVEDEEELESHAHGTKVGVHNLFGKMPVRVKQRALKMEHRAQAEKEFVAIRNALVGFVLAAKQLRTVELVDYITTRQWRCRLDVSRATNLFDTTRIASIFHQAALTSSKTSTNWRVLSARSSGIVVRAAFFLEPVASTSRQFWSFGPLYVSTTQAAQLSVEVNTLFAASSFGTADRGTSKGVDRWPMFYIRVDQVASTNSQPVRLDEAVTTRHTRVIWSLVQMVAAEFLSTCDHQVVDGHAGASKRRTRRPREEAEPVVTSQHFRSRGFDMWSRIKSSTGGNDPDILCGLPFQQPSTRCAEPRIASETDSPAGPSKRQEAPLSMLAANALRLLGKPPHDPPMHRVYGQNREDSWHIDGLAVSNERIASRIDRSSLKQARLLRQVDSKYLLISVATPGSDDGAEPTDLLVLVDQHAADERIKVEELFARVCSADAVLHLSTPLVFEVPRAEIDLFVSRREHFAAWRIHYDITTDQDQSCTPMIRVRALPDVISERCRVEPKLLIDLMRRELGTPRSPRVGGCLTWVGSDGDCDWLSRMATCPTGLIDMLNSRACRSAVMFNDALCQAQCRSLLTRLSDCMFPFHCAHGRPSMAILVRLPPDQHEESTFRQAWNAWTVEAMHHGGRRDG